MSPTVLLVGGFRFYFFSREESRLHVHVHVQHAAGEAKVWLEPRVELAATHGLGPRRTRRAIRLVEEHRDDIRRAWRQHFGS